MLEKLKINIKYSDVPVIRPPMVLVESGLNIEQVSLLRPIYIEKKNFGTIISGLNSEGGFNCE